MVVMNLLEEVYKRTKGDHSRKPKASMKPALRLFW